MGSTVCVCFEWGVCADPGPESVSERTPPTTITSFATCCVCSRRLTEKRLRQGSSKKSSRAGAFIVGKRGSHHGRHGETCSLFFGHLCQLQGVGARGPGHGVAQPARNQQRDTRVPVAPLHCPAASTSASVPANGPPTLTSTLTMGPSSPFWCRSYRMSEPPTNSPLMKICMCLAAMVVRHLGPGPVAFAPGRAAADHVWLCRPACLRNRGPVRELLDALAQRIVGQHVGAAVLNLCVVEMRNRQASSHDQQHKKTMQQPDKLDKL